MRWRTKNFNIFCVQKKIQVLVCVCVCVCGGGGVMKNKYTGGYLKGRGFKNFRFKGRVGKKECSGVLGEGWYPNVHYMHLHINESKFQVHDYNCLSKLIQTVIEVSLYVKKSNLVKKVGHTSEFLFGIYWFTWKTTIYLKNWLTWFNKKSTDFNI